MKTATKRFCDECLAYGHEVWCSLNTTPIGATPIAALEQWIAIDDRGGEHGIYMDAGSNADAVMRIARGELVNFQVVVSVKKAS